MDNLIFEIRVALCRNNSDIHLQNGTRMQISLTLQLQTTV